MFEKDQLNELFLKDQLCSASRVDFKFRERTSSALSTFIFLFVCLFGLELFFHSTNISNVSDVETGILFLKAKGVLDSSPFADQIFSFLRDPPQAGPASGFYEAARQRLLKLISEEKIHSNSTPPGLHAWSTTEFPGYNPSDVFFLKHPNSLNQGLQLTDLCYMYPPALIQHYSLVHTHNSAPVIDLVNFIRNNFSTAELEHHIFDDTGTYSVEFLRSILQPNSSLIAKMPIDIPDALTTYGPGLVSHFSVHQDFFNSSAHSHYGRNSGELIGVQAMALVGYRKNENTLYFLLQNCWKFKQFVEVDISYLLDSGASIWFIETPQTAIPKDIPVNYAKYFELGWVDKSERTPHQKIH